MIAKATFNRLVLRAVLRNVSPMVIRVISVPNSLDLPDFDEVFRTVLASRTSREGNSLWFVKSRLRKRRLHLVGIAGWFETFPPRFVVIG